MHRQSIVRGDYVGALGRDWNSSGRRGVSWAMQLVRHLRFQRQIDAWFDGQLGASVDALAVAHLDECPGCRGDLLLLVDMKVHLGAGMPTASR